MSEFTVCQNPDILRIIYFIKILINIVKTVVPIALIILITANCAKAVISNDDSIKTALNNSKNKLLSAIIIFAVPTIIDIVFAIINQKTDYQSCWANANAETIEYYQSLMDQLEPPTPDYDDDSSGNTNTEPSIPDDDDDSSGNTNVKPSTPDDDDDSSGNTNVKPSTPDDDDDSSGNTNIKPPLPDDDDDSSGNTNIEPPIQDDDDNDSSGSGSGDLELHFIKCNAYDDAILIRTSNNTIMIDGGRKSCKDVVVNYLKEIGTKRIDALIGSHVHFNHVQVHANILDAFIVKKAYYPVDIRTCAAEGYCDGDAGDESDDKYTKEKLEEKGTPVQILKPKDKLTIGEMKIYVLGPKNTYKKGEGKKYYQNVNSLIFILQYGENTFMFTGDTSEGLMKSDDVKENAKYFNIPLNVDVLKYPHHGNTTLSLDTLQLLDPEYVLIPNGNAGYPNEKSDEDNSNRNNIATVGAKIYESTKHGNIVLLSDGKKITIKTNQKASDYAR